MKFIINKIGFGKTFLPKFLSLKSTKPSLISDVIYGKIHTQFIFSKNVTIFLVPVIQKNKKCVTFYSFTTAQLDKIITLSRQIIVCQPHAQVQSWAKERMR